MKSEDLARVIEDMITHDDYREKNPEIDKLNVFSISTLAYDYMAQYRKKTGQEKSHPTNFDMFHGKAIHEYLQKRFMDFGYLSEVKLVHVLPFDWEIDALKNENITLIGHVDLYSPADETLIELKSSLWSDKISEYMIRQAATYAYIMRGEGYDVSYVYVVKVNSKISIYQLTEDDILKYYNEIEERAYNVAEKLRNDVLSGKLEVRGDGKSEKVA